MGLSALSFENGLKMPRGPKKHLKRLAAPKSWMLSKLGGVFTCRPSSGPHKMRESMPIALFLRNRLNYALNMKEVSSIMKQRLVKIDGKVRTDTRFPAGFMDVVQLAKTNENFRLIYDVKGRFCVHRITPEEAKYKLCRVIKVSVGPNPVPLIKVNDSIRVDVTTNKIMDFIKFDTGNICMVTGGHNTGRVGIVMNRERHQGSFDIVHVKDAAGHTFATRLSY